MGFRKPILKNATHYIAVVKPFKILMMLKSMGPKLVQSCPSFDSGQLTPEVQSPPPYQRCVATGAEFKTEVAE